MNSYPILYCVHSRQNSLQLILLDHWTIFEDKNAADPVGIERGTKKIHLLNM